MIRTAPTALEPGGLWRGMTAEASDVGITRLHLAGRDPARPEPGVRTGRRAVQLVADGRLGADGRLVADALSQVREYLCGRRRQFDVPIDLSDTTPFRRSVFDALLDIPFGETASYGDIAALLGCRSPRAVGQAVGANPIPILIPCHRVVTSDGRLGGFSCGLDYKVALLGVEGIVAEAATFRSPIAGVG